MKTCITAITVFFIGLLPVSLLAKDCPVGDLYQDCEINILDLVELVNAWLSVDPVANLDGNGSVDMADVAILSDSWSKEGTPLLISEFMAGNDTSFSTVVDGQTVYPDWIEIYNPLDLPYDLSGWYLTDDETDLTQWQFPAGSTINANGYLLVCATNKDNADYPYVDEHGYYHTNFSLKKSGESLLLVAPDGVTISYAYLDFPALEDDQTYGIAFNESETPTEYVFLETATPEMTNGIATYYVADTKFSVDRGFYTDPISVAISTETPGATIRYTTDGSWPTDTTGFVYTAPIAISTTTCLRAIAAQSGYVPSNVDTQTYIFLDDVITQTRPSGYPTQWGYDGANRVTADYNMQPGIATADHLKSIPTMSIVMSYYDLFGIDFGQTGNNALRGLFLRTNDQGLEWERRCSVEFFDPSGEMDDFQENCAIRIYGGVGRYAQFKKHALRLLFKPIYGQSSLPTGGPTKLRYPLFGQDAADEFDTIILRAGFNNTWHRKDDINEEKRAQYLRDEWIRKTQLDMGMLGLHGSFVHLYVNGMYWGLYNPTERANADFGSSYFGGEKEEWDALNSEGSGEGIVDGDFDFDNQLDSNAWFAAIDIANVGVSAKAGYDALAGYVDIPNLIDYMMLNFYAGNHDWDFHNWYAVRRSDRAGFTDGGWKFLSWDSERSLEEVSGHDVTNRATYGKPSNFHSALSQNPEYRMMFADSIQKRLFNDGELSPAKTAARYQALADTIDSAIVGESARWGDSQHSVDTDNPRDPYPHTYTRDVEWVTERDRLLYSYFPGRTDSAFVQMRNRGLYPSIHAPVYKVNSVHSTGGYVDPNDQITIAASDAGTIYYTLDGIDPRIPWAVMPDDVMVGENADKKALVPTSDIGSSWQIVGYNDSSWSQGSPVNYINLDGEDYVDCGTNPAYDITGSITVACWTQVNRFNEDSIVCKGDGTWRLMRHWEDRVKLNCTDVGECGGDIPINDGKWHHIAGVYDQVAGKMRLYVDGQLDKQEDKSGSMPVRPNDPLHIGARGGNGRFNGGMMDVRIYSRALSDSEVALLASLGDPSSSGLVGWWKLDGNLNDSSSTNNDGTYVDRDSPPGSPQWLVKKPQAVGFEQNLGDATNYNSMISINVESPMQSNNSCYVRFPFNVSGATDYVTLNMGVQYDDGFIAYVNGMEVASANAPASPQYDSSATSTNQDDQAILFQDFDLSSHIGLLDEGENMLAIQALNHSSDTSDFLINATLSGNKNTIADSILPEAIILQRTEPSVNNFDLVTETSTITSIVPTNDSLESVWMTEGYNPDGRWTSGTNGVGYDRNSDYLPYININVENEMDEDHGGSYDTNYVRAPFTIPVGALDGGLTLTLTMRVDDGFVAYLNGAEVYRFNFTGTPAWNSHADNAPGDSYAMNIQYYDISSFAHLLHEGSNVLAVQGLDVGPGSSDYLILPGLELSQSIPSSEDPFTIDKSSIIKSRIFNGTEWSALSKAVFAVGPVLENLRITEIMYHPTDPTAAELAIDPNFTDEDFEFIELKNIGSGPMNLNLVSFTDGIDYTFGDTTLAGGDFIIVVKSQSAFAARYGVGINVASGSYTGSLSNNGEKIRLRDATDSKSLTFDYNDTWFTVTDGMGYSLDKLTPDTAVSDSWDKQSGWRSSSSLGGTPGSTDTGHTLMPEDILISEILSHSDGGVGDWIEIWNTTGSAVNIGGWFFSDSESNLAKYEIAPGDPRATIPANSYVVFDQVNDFGNSGDSGSHEQFGLSEHGESVYLTSGLNGELTGMYSTEQEDFGAAENGITIGVYFKSVLSTDAEDFVRLGTVTKGSANNDDPMIGPVVISELMYNPQDLDAEAEYVELTNITGGSVPLFDPANPANTWKIKGIGFEFPQSITLGANEIILITRSDPAQFRSSYGIAGGIRIFGPYAGSLDNGGEKITLIQPGDPDLPDPITGEIRVPKIRIDRVNYDDENPWPTQPDGNVDGIGNISLSRAVLTEYGNDVENWAAALPTPGTPNLPPDTTPPTPPQTTWFSPPAAVSATSITMTANAGSDISGPVEYYFTETSGNSGGTDSGWQSSLSYTDTGLNYNTQYSYTVTMRDALHNVGNPSAPASSTTDSIPPSGNGLLGKYYNDIVDGQHFTNLVLTRTDATVNFNWGSGSPDASVTSDDFSARWEGYVIPEHSEVYTFYTHSDDGVRLWVNDQLIISNWTDHGGTEDSGTIALTAAQIYSIKLEYYENGGGAEIKLSWESPSTPKAIIPETRLYNF